MDPPLRAGGRLTLDPPDRAAGALLRDGAGRAELPLPGAGRLTDPRERPPGAGARTDVPRDGGLAAPPLDAGADRVAEPPDGRLRADGRLAAPPLDAGADRVAEPPDGRLRADGRLGAPPLDGEVEGTTPPRVRSVGRDRGAADDAPPRGDPARAGATPRAAAPGEPRRGVTADPAPARPVTAPERDPGRDAPTRGADGTVPGRAVATRVRAGALYPVNGATPREPGYT
ncbi:MAG: hypothetical protein P8188_01060 [Gemmatimonadota bacterium]